MVWGRKPERRAQPSDRHRGSGGGGKSAAEIELGEGLVRSGPRGGDDHLLGSDLQVVEDAAGDGRIGDEREHAQGIAAARALGDLVAEHPAQQRGPVEPAGEQQRHGWRGGGRRLRYGQKPDDLIALSAVVANHMIGSEPLATRMQKFIMVFVDGECQPQQSGVPVDPSGDRCEQGTFYLDAPLGGTARSELNLLELMDHIDATYRTKHPSAASYAPPDSTHDRVRSRVLIEIMDRVAGTHLSEELPDPTHDRQGLLSDIRNRMTFELEHAIRYGLLRAERVEEPKVATIDLQLPSRLARFRSVI